MKKLYLITLLLTLININLSSQDWKIEKITDKIIAFNCFYVEEHRSFTILSENGMIQIDTYYFPWLTKDAKELIIKETGREDFKYFINTHAHACHVGGNYYFKDVTFITQERTKSNLEWGIEHSKDQYNKLNALENKDSIQLKKLADHEFKMKNTPLPDITFRDHMTINTDDITINLIYFGNCGHSDDEILIHIPEEKTLIIGQIFHGSKYLPVIKESASRKDLQRKIDVMSTLLETDLEHIYSNHQGRIDLDDFTFAKDYYMDLLTHIEKLKNQSYTLEQVQAEFKFANRYPEVNDKHNIKEDRENVHIKNVENIWKMMERE